MPTPRSLRDYQELSLTRARSEFAKGFRCILIQLPTGTGKTRMITAAINNAISKPSPVTGKPQTVWFIVPRRELLWQSNEELNAWGIKNQIVAGTQQTSGFQVYVWSRDTLKRRITTNKIRKWPDIILIDEAHLALDQQLFIRENAPKSCIFLGLSATPERLDGRGLNEMWDSLVQGESLQYFVEYGYLKKPLVYSVPQGARITAGLDLKYTTNGDPTKATNAELSKAYAIRAKKTGIMYGDEIEHYNKFGAGRPCLIFCRSIEQAEKVAQEFTEADIPVESIDGGMTDKVRKDKIYRVKNDALKGLATVDLCTYGLDVPKISCLILLRPTQSTALFFQMIGRGLRPDPEHSDCLILDHVGNCDMINHGHPLMPRQWNFKGDNNRKKAPRNACMPVDAVKKCPVCWDLIIEIEQDGKTFLVCRSCGTPYESGVKPLKQVDGWLVEINEPTPLKERPIENQRQYQDMINSNIDAFRNDWENHGTVNRQAVENLLEAANDLKWKNGVKQVYYRLAPESNKIINVSLIAAIREIKGYHPFWAKRFRQELEMRGLR